jgi:hypothetical protein
MVDFLENILEISKFFAQGKNGTAIRTRSLLQNSLDHLLCRRKRSHQNLVGPAARID